MKRIELIPSLTRTGSSRLILDRCHRSTRCLQQTVGGQVRLYVYLEGGLPGEPGRVAADAAPGGSPSQLQVALCVAQLPRVRPGVGEPCRRVYPLAEAGADAARSHHLCGTATTQPLHIKTFNHRIS